MPKILGTEPSCWDAICGKLVILLNLQATPLKEQSNMILTYCQALYHQLKGSTGCHLLDLLRLGNKWVGTSKWAGLGLASLPMGPHSF